MTYQLAELTASKLRALYQRRKGRDLFDIWLVFSKKLVERDMALDVFRRLCEHDRAAISKDLFCQNLKLKRLNKDFHMDMSVLLSPAIQYNFDEAFEFVQNAVISRL
jgi:predicted nucleotidyltransferase component of viral defense system